MRSLANTIRRWTHALTARALRGYGHRLIERYAPNIAERLYSGARWVANLPFRAERIDVPEPIEVGSRQIDIVADLAAYTKLPSEEVAHELQTRSRLSFRAEWHEADAALRLDHWFYLSSKGYLFANATHFTDEWFVDRYVLPHVQAESRVLDFGGGTGNLALILAARGIDVCLTELNALQRDFVRFRVARYGLDNVHVLDWWEDLPRNVFSVVIAVDVLEHLDNCRDVLSANLLPSLTDDGVLIENSPFVVNVSNPMHHENFGFEAHMQGAGFDISDRGRDGTRIWGRAASRKDNVAIRD